VNCPPLPISLSFWVELVGACNLITLMDEIGPSDRVLLIAATNRPDSIDPALWCSRRLDKEIEIGIILLSCPYIFKVERPLM
jgi:hypothetical protein